MQSLKEGQDSLLSSGASGFPRSRHYLMLQFPNANFAIINSSTGSSLSKCCELAVAHAVEESPAGPGELIIPRSAKDGSVDIDTGPGHWLAPICVYCNRPRPEAARISLSYRLVGAAPESLPAGIGAHGLGAPVDQHVLRVDRTVEDHPVTEVGLQPPQVHAGAGRLDRVQGVQSGVEQRGDQRREPAAAVKLDLQPVVLPEVDRAFLMRQDEPLEERRAQQRAGLPAEVVADEEDVYRLGGCVEDAPASGGGQRRSGRTDVAVWVGESGVCGIKGEAPVE